MKKSLLSALVLVGLNFVSNVEAKDQYVGPNFSGIYSCKGTNNKVGEYEVVATLKLNRISSHGSFGVYDFNTETENALVYKGQAIASGYRLALTFNLSDARNADYSTGIADIQKISSTRWAYTNHYYEPDENGGDSGSEYCVMQKPVKMVKATKKIKKLPAVVPAQS
jgi:hypothetical protein